MSKPRIALVVDHPRRDLAGMVLTAFELCQQGAICYLVPANLAEKEIWALAPEFVLLNYLRRGNEKLIKQLDGAGIQFSVLDTEGGVLPNLESYSELLCQDISLLKKASCVCLWGPRIAEYVISQGIFSEKQVTITGCPRFDFYHPMWQSVLYDEAIDGVNRLTNRILINTNFSTTNPRFVSIEKKIEDGIGVYGWAHSTIMSTMEAEKQAIEATLDLARNLARDYPQSRIVIRPHPFEGAEIYRGRLRDLDNIEVNVTGPVQPQIFRAAVVIQRSCSTGIEAGLASIPTLSPQWIASSSLIQMAEAVSVPCSSYSDLRSKLEAIFKKQYKLPTEIKSAVDTVIHDWFYRIDGLSHKRVSAAILGCLNGRRSVNERLCSGYLYGSNGSQPGGLTRLSRALRHGLGLSPDWSFRRMRPVPNLGWISTDKYFGVVEVRNLTERIRSALRLRGCNPRTVAVESSRGRGDYSHNYFGHSVTVTCDA